MCRPSLRLSGRAKRFSANCTAGSLPTRGRSECSDFIQAVEHSRSVASAVTPLSNVNPKLPLIRFLHLIFGYGANGQKAHSRCRCRDDNFGNGPLFNSVLPVNSVLRSRHYYDIATRCEPDTRTCPSTGGQRSSEAKTIKTIAPSRDGAEGRTSRNWNVSSDALHKGETMSETTTETTTGKKAKASKKTAKANKASAPKKSTKATKAKGAKSFASR